jgi:hypothetical protein
VDGSEIPTCWRPYWVIVTAATAALMMIEDDYRFLIPALVGYGAACFWFEYFATHHRYSDEPVYRPRG